MDSIACGWVNMPTKIVILSDGSEEFGQTSDECLEKLYHFIERDSLLMKNTMKRFSEELIYTVLQIKSNFTIHMPMSFTNVRPVALLNNVGHYFFIFRLMDRFDQTVVDQFHRGKQLLHTVEDTSKSMLKIMLKYFSCVCHSIDKECPISGNSTLLDNFLCFLAFSIRLATLAYIEGIPNAPKWIAVIIAYTIKEIHERLMSVGGWKKIKLICEGFASDPISVQRVNFILCNTNRVAL